MENLRGIFLKSFKSGPGRLGNEEEEGFLIRGCKYLTVSQEESGERKKYIQEKAKDRVDLLNFISLSSEFLTETSFQEFS